jgi:hypothetical protein
MVHWTLVGWAPPDAAIDTARATDEPGVALPEPSDSVTCCAMAGLIATEHKIEASKCPVLRRRSGYDVMPRMKGLSSTSARMCVRTYADMVLELVPTKYYWRLYDHNDLKTASRLARA